MSRLNNSVLAQAMGLMAIGMLSEASGDMPFEITSREATKRDESEYIERRKRHEAGRRADAEKAKAEYDAKAQTFRDDRAARKAAAFAKRQPKR